MTTVKQLPEVGHVYLGGPTIRPAWLAGRRLLVEATPTWRDVCDELGRRAGLLDLDAVAFVHVKVLARGRTTIEQVSPEDWDGLPVTPRRTTP